MEEYDYDINKLIEEFGEYNPNDPEAIYKKASENSKLEVNFDNIKQYNPNEKIDNYSSEESSINMEKFDKFEKGMKTILYKNIEQQLLSKGEFEFPKAKSIVQITLFFFKAIYIKNPIYRQELKKSFNQETLKIRSTFNSILSNLDKFSNKDLNVKTDKKVEKYIRSTIEKDKLFTYLRLVWIGKKLEKRSPNMPKIPMKIGYELIENSLKSLTPFYPNLIYYFSETTNRAKYEILKLEEKFKNAY